MTGMSVDTRARRAAAQIRDGFKTYERDNLEIARRAAQRFAQRDWRGMQQDAKERLTLYGRVLDKVVEEVRAVLGPDGGGTDTWGAIRDVYAESIIGHPAIEVAETFYNSVTRRVLVTVGVNTRAEFLDFEFERVPMLIDAPYRAYSTVGTTESVVRTVLQDFAFRVPFAHVDRDARLVAQRIEEQWAKGLAPVPFEDLELLDTVFYRRKGAYLVGRVRGGNRVMPLVVVLAHRDDGIAVDAVLVREDEVSVLFGFTRSYFHVDISRPSDVIGFLRSIMPVKPVWELYTALGYHKHGKTELYRHLQRHLSWTDECFEIAAGAKGMVMAVFAMPSLDVVFKVIRDSFPYPKQTTPAGVKRRYQIVFEHDRVGRLVDAQEFEHLAFPRERFSKRLLAELLETASRSVSLEGDHVVISHLYTERRVRPLDLYVSDADPDRVVRAMLDYGQAIRDLAATNVFPGDLLLKNFGVTRHGRVVFYDYDELCLLSDCVFRKIPQASCLAEEMGEEPWYGVGRHDIFPEELVRFLPLEGDVRAAFLAAHGVLFDPDFWQELKERNAAGEVVDVFPYPVGNRLV